VQLAGQVIAAEPRGRGIRRHAPAAIPELESHVRLLVLVVILAIRAVTLPGASAGLAFLFTPEWSDLLSARIWLEALTQNAWDTGAGWGLIVAYAVYMREQEDTTLNAFLLGFGNNSVSLLAGIMVLCTVFALMPEAADTIVGAGNEGLTFVWVPQLFGQMPGGTVFMVLFFLALVFAAWSSLIAMIELASRILVDLGMRRPLAIAIVGGAGFLLGLPSALSLDFFRNQDWVWGVGLMLSGFFFAFGVLKYGVDRFRQNLINRDTCDIQIGRWWNVVIRIVALEAVVLMVWWLYQAVDTDNLAATFTPFSTFNVGSVLVQWGIALGILILLNGWLNRKMSGR